MRIPRASALRLPPHSRLRLSNLLHSCRSRFRFSLLAQSLEDGRLQHSTPYLPRPRRHLMAFFHQRKRRNLKAPSARRLFQPTLESLEPRLALSTMTFTVLNTANSGAGSLSKAILDANANPGADLIAFNIGGGGVQTIAPTSA